MKVKLAEYTPEWINLFQKEKKLILDKLGDKIVTVEHIGSTAVRGLGAKPIVDILLGVWKISDADEFIPKMIELGYEYRNNFENVMPYRRYFTKPGYYHVHTVEVTSAFWRRHLLFRDYMRAHNEIRDAYFKAKRKLAEQEWDDTNDYAYAKTEFIKKAESFAFKEFTFITENAECDALYDLYSKAPPEVKKSSGLKTERMETAALIRAGVPDFPHNKVTGLGIEKEIDEEVLLKVKEFYSGSGYKFSIRLVDFMITDNVKMLLKKHSFVHMKNWVRFYRDTAPLQNVKTDLEIRPVGNKYGETFGRLITETFGFSTELKGVFSSIMEDRNWKHFMAFNGEKPVSAGSVYLNGETAWIGFAATLPEYRGHGAQGAILSARIDEARKRGCKWISVETVEDTSEHDAPSYRNMLRYGFRLLYKKPNYVFEPKQ